jgi:cystathionine beta-synthase
MRAEARSLSSESAGLLSLIGGTPIVELQGFDTGPCQLFLKLESQNPTGSIKDRIALSMVHAAAAEGILAPGDTIVEATSGNTGLALGLVAAIEGYHMIAVIPDKMSPEKIEHLRALGVEVRITRSDVDHDHPEYYERLAVTVAEAIGALHIDQFSNPANAQAHVNTTGPEIWEQLDHRVDAVVCGVGSGGTMTGLSRFFASVSPELELVMADPEGSSLATFVEMGTLGPSSPYVVEGIGNTHVPAVADLSRVRRAYVISDEESIVTVKRLLRRTGIFAGTSSGTLIAAALRYCRVQDAPKRVVTFVCDSGSKYMSKVFGAALDSRRTTIGDIAFEDGSEAPGTPSYPQSRTRRDEGGTAMTASAVTAEMGYEEGRP